MKTAPSLSFEWLEEAHAAGLYEGFRDAAVSRFTADGAPASLQDLQREFAAFSAGAPPGRNEVWLNWAIREAGGAELLGTVQATLFADGAWWIGYKLVRRAWGRGVATAAVRWLLRELQAHAPGRMVFAATDTRNHASQRVLQKCDFQYLRTEAAEIRGEPTLDHVYRYRLPD